MAVIGTAGASWLGGRIDVENNTRDFLPIGVGFFSIEKTHIGDRVLLVIRRQCRLIRSQIRNFGIKRWHAENSYR